jgi:hypothetical protein
VVVKRTAGRIALAGLFCLFAAVDVFQLVHVALGIHPDPPALIVLHALTALLAGLACAAIWRGWPRAHLLVLGWGLATAAMLVLLGPLADDPPESWRGYRIAAAAVAVLAAAAAWYVRRSAPARVDARRARS